MTPLDTQVCRGQECCSGSEVMVSEEVEPMSGREGYGDGVEKEEDSIASSKEEGSIVSGKPKHGALKRVSFGSSKGSMVETIVFDYDGTPYKPIPHANPLSVATTREEHINVTPPAKVRVTFFESQKPHYVTTPDSSEFSFNLSMLSSTMASPEDVQKYISMNMGIENPFRPEGDLSKEAESLVRQVQTGQPLTKVELAAEPLLQRSTIEDSMTSPTRSANGAPGHSSMPSSPTMLDVQHGIVVPPTSSTSVEQVIIKKKPKCQCCVII